MALAERDHQLVAIAIEHPHQLEHAEQRPAEVRGLIDDENAALHARSKQQCCISYAIGGG